MENSQKALAIIRTMHQEYMQARARWEATNVAVNYHTGIRDAYRVHDKVYPHGPALEQLEQQREEGRRAMMAAQEIYEHCLETLL